MIVNVYKGDELIQSVDSTRETSTYKRDRFGRRKETPLEYRTRKRQKNFSVIIEREEVETKEETSGSHYVEQTTPQPVAENDITRYRPSEFNQRTTLSDVPTIDGMYRNMNVQTFTRSGDMYQNGVNTSDKKEDRTRVEDTLDIVSRAIYSSNDIKEEPVEEPEIQEEDPVEVPEYDIDEGDYNSDEYQDSDEKPEDSGEDDELPFELEIELRGEDAIKEKFGDRKSQVDSAFFD